MRRLIAGVVFVSLIAAVRPASADAILISTQGSLGGSVLSVDFDGHPAVEINTQYATFNTPFPDAPAWDVSDGLSLTLGDTTGTVTGHNAASFTSQELSGTLSASAVGVDHVMSGDQTSMNASARQAVVFELVDDQLFSLTSHLMANGPLWTNGWASFSLTGPFSVLMNDRAFAGPSSDDVFTRTGLLAPGIYQLVAIVHGEGIEGSDNGGSRGWGNAALDYTFAFTSPSPQALVANPEPGTWLLLGTGLIGLVWAKTRLRRA